MSLLLLFIPTPKAKMGLSLSTMTVGLLLQHILRGNASV